MPASDVRVAVQQAGDNGAAQPHRILSRRHEAAEAEVALGAASV